MWCLLSFISAVLLSVASAEPKQGPVLFIGDSHSVQGFGKRFDQLLREVYKDQVFTRARWGSSPHWWLDPSFVSPRFFDRDPGAKGVGKKHPRPVPNLPELLKAIRPTLVVIELGANLHGMFEINREFIRESVARITAVVRESGAACVWIGPADGRKLPRVRELHELIQKSVGTDCLMIDSLSKTSYPRIFGDGLRYDKYSVTGPRIARKWAEKSFQEMREALSTCAQFTKPWCGQMSGAQ